MGIFFDDKLETMEDLLLSQVKDLYDAENRIYQCLPDMISKAHNPNLKRVLQSHHTETYEHIKRLEEVFEALNESPERETCKAAKGLLDEAEELINKDGQEDVIDAAIIAASQRIEHYEISAYGSAKAFANKCGNGRIAMLLEQTLKDEKRADEMLTHVAFHDVNDSAAAAL